MTGNGMRVLVCGGRDYNNAERIRRELSSLPTLPTLIIEGGARGADHQGKMWALVNMVPFQTFPAKWKIHGRAAGAIRNQQMLEKGRPDLVVAFPGGRGTADMVRRAKAAGVPVKEIIDDDR